MDLNPQVLAALVGAMVGGLFALLANSSLVTGRNVNAKPWRPSSATPSGTATSSSRPTRTACTTLRNWPSLRS